MIDTNQHGYQRCKKHRPEDAADHSYTAANTNRDCYVIHLLTKQMSMGIPRQRTRTMAPISLVMFPLLVVVDLYRHTCQSQAESRRTHRNRQQRDRQLHTDLILECRASSQHVAGLYLYRMFLLCLICSDKAVTCSSALLLTYLHLESLGPTGGQQGANRLSMSAIVVWYGSKHACEVHM